MYVLADADKVGTLRKLFGASAYVDSTSMCMFLSSQIVAGPGVFSALPCLFSSSVLPTSSIIFQVKRNFSSPRIHFLRQIVSPWVCVSAKSGCRSAPGIFFVISHVIFCLCGISNALWLSIIVILIVFYAKIRTRRQGSLHSRTNSLTLLASQFYPN